MDNQVFQVGEIFIIPSLAVGQGGGDIVDTPASVLSFIMPISKKIQHGFSPNLARYTSIYE